MNKKRLLAIIMTVMLIVGMLPPGTFVYADEAAELTLVYTDGTVETRYVSRIYSIFSGINTLKSVSVKGDLEYIDSDAFHNCKSLVDVTFGGNVGDIGGCAFTGCTSLTSVSFGGNVGDIGKDAFMGCTSLTSVSFPGNVGDIGYGAFHGCTSLTSVSFSGNVGEIGAVAFNGCRFTSVSFPGKVVIGDDAFENCQKLGSITFKDPAFGSIGAAFRMGCSKFEEVYFDGTLAQWMQIPIANNWVDKSIDIHCEYNVAVNPDDGGTAEANVSYDYDENTKTASIGVYVTAESNDGYRFVNWTGDGITFADATAPETTLTTFDPSATATANFEKVYKVTVINDGNGTGMAHPTSGPMGTEVTLTATPDDDYRFKAWMIIEGFVTVNENRFRIGDADVTLLATFELIPPDDISTATVTASDQTYDGTEKKPVPTVTWNGKTLTEGIDYDVTAYADNIDAGEATVTVTGKGKFAGTAKGKFKVAPARATITVADASKVEGEEDPAFTGTVEGLIADGDLGEISYKRTGNDEAPGTYKGVLIANYTDNPNYDVTVTKGDFTITEKPVYEAASGSGGTYTKGSGKTLTFTYKRSADDGTTFGHFKGITVDGKAVPEKDSSGKANWTAKKGSVIIELQPSYLEMLSVGEHKLAVQFDDGADATSTFTVKAKAATPTKATTTAPKTGDESNMLMWFLLICASLFVMSRIISLRNRR